MENPQKKNQYQYQAMPPTPTIPPGQFFRAAAHPDLQQTRPMAVFVPDTLIKDGALDAKGYQTQRWHSINAGINQHAIGSHLFPDVTQPVESTPDLEKALLQMIQKTIGNPSRARRPGILGQQNNEGMEMH